MTIKFKYWMAIYHKITIVLSIHMLDNELQNFQYIWISTQHWLCISSKAFA